MGMHGLGPTRAEVLSLLQKSSTPLTAAQVAEELGLHPNSARHHLGEMYRDGYVERTTLPSTGTGRPSIGFSPTSKAPQVNVSHIVSLTASLLTHFCGEDPSVASEIGVSTARRTFPDGVSGGELMEYLDDAGFAPQVIEDELHLTRCPYRAHLDKDAMEAVCSMHAGFLGELLGDRLGEVTIGKTCIARVAGLGCDQTITGDYIVEGC